MSIQVWYNNSGRINNMVIGRAIYLNGGIYKTGDEPIHLYRLSVNSYTDCEGAYIIQKNNKATIFLRKFIPGDGVVDIPLDQIINPNTKIRVKGRGMRKTGIFIESKDGSPIEFEEITNIDVPCVIMFEEIE